MNKKPPELPNIEDATLRACLAPLMDAMNAGGEPSTQTLAPTAVARPLPPAVAGAGSNDNPSPAAGMSGSHSGDAAYTPKTLAEWRSQADEDFAALRMVELFLAMTDAELATAVAEFPRQITGTVARIARMKQHLAAQYDKVTAAIALLHRAQDQASAGTKSD